MIILIPMSELDSLDIPEVAITDGSSDPIWVSVPCDGGLGWRIGPVLRLPFDRSSAATAAQWARAFRRNKTIVFPLTSIIFLAAISILFLRMEYAPPWFPSVFSVLLVTGISWRIVPIFRERRLRLPVLPRLYNGGIFIENVPEGVAQQWLRKNRRISLIPEPKIQN